MSMPKRPKQHQVEDLSIIAFQRLLPREWVYREKDKDYGIDGEVEIFEEDGTATGVIFYVQLKATDSKDEKAQKRVRLKNDAINYYKALELPVLIARYITETEEIYFKWAHSIDRYKHKKSEETFSFVVTDENLWKDKTAKDIHDFLVKLSILKIKNNLFPINVLFDLNFSEICGYKPYSVKSRIRTKLSNKSSYFQIVNDEKDCEFRVNLSDDEISVFILGGVTGSYLHSIDYISYKNIDELIGDIFVAISLALSSFNKTFNAYETIELFTKQSQYIKSPNVCIHFTQLCFSIGKIKKANELWNNVPNEKKDEVLNAEFQLQSLIASNNYNYNDEDVEAHEQYLLQQIKEDDEKGTVYYNYANFLHNERRLREAFSNYRKAFKYEKGYHQAEHIYQEVAGTLFDLKRYRLSSMCYKKVLDIKYDPNVEARYADSLMMNGEFTLAYKSFENYIKKSDTYDEERILKDAALKYIIDEYKIETQIRQPRLAEKQEVFNKLGKKIVSMEELQDVIKIDALNSLAWFNLGWLYKENADWENAMPSYLLCALVNRRDVEAWILAYKCAWNANNIEFAMLITKVGYQINGEEFIQEVYSLFEEMAETVPKEIKEKLFELLEEMLESNHISKIDNEPTFRIFDGEKFRDIFKESEDIMEEIENYHEKLEK